MEQYICIPRGMYPNFVHDWCMDKKSYHLAHFAEWMRCNDDIQLLEGPILLLCPWAGLALSFGRTGFEACRFDVPPTWNEVEGMCSLTIYKRNQF